MQNAVATAYLEHLTVRDQTLLLTADPGARDLDPRRRSVLAGPGEIDRRLARPEIFDAVFEARHGDEALLGTSPFLVFAVAVARARTQLASATYVSEWLGPRRRAPVFDVAPLQDFLSVSWRRLFLAELLASYTHVSSGSVMVSTRRGRRRQRFSELDPVRLAALLEAVPDAQRPGVLRRLGDLALFLTGVFPDQVALRGFGPVAEVRLRRSGGLGPPGTAAGPDPGDVGAVELLDALGRRWYRAAFRHLVPPIPASMSVVGELPDRFGQARRILNVVTDQLIFRRRELWFGFGTG